MTVWSILVSSFSLAVWKYLHTMLCFRAMYKYLSPPFLFDGLHATLSLHSTHVFYHSRHALQIFALIMEVGTLHGWLSFRSIIAIRFPSPYRSGYLFQFTFGRFNLQEECVGGWVIDFCSWMPLLLIVNGWLAFKFPPIFRMVLLYTISSLCWI